VDRRAPKVNARFRPRGQIFISFDDALMGIPLLSNGIMIFRLNFPGLFIHFASRTTKITWEKAYPRRILTGASPNVLENAREKPAALAKPVRSAMLAIGSRVSRTSRRAALSRNLR
jgi:hypothetical protein